MNTFLKSTTILFGLNLIANALNYLYQIFAAKVLNVEDFGTLNTIFSYMTIVAVPGITITMIVAREFAISTKNNDFSYALQFVKSVFRNVLFLTIVVFLLELFCSFLISRILKIDETSTLLLTFIISALGYFYPLYSGCFTGLKKFAFLGFYALLLPLCKLAGLVVAYFFTDRMSICLISILCASICTAIVGHSLILKFLKNKVSSPTNNKIKLNLRSWLDPLIINLCFTFFSCADILLVRFIGTEQESGLYSAIMLFGKIVYYATVTIGTVLIPFSATIDNKKGIKLLNNALLLVAGLCIAGLLLLVVFKTQLIQLIYGDNYLDSQKFVSATCVFALAVGLMTILVNYLVARSYVIISKWIFLAGMCFIPCILFLTKDVISSLFILGVIGYIIDLALYISYRFHIYREETL